MNMNKFFVIITATILSCSSFIASANADKANASINDQKAESVQVEKNNIPETTATGDYLKQQPATNNIRKEFDKSSEQGGVDLET
jgi:hypothetical protein